MRNNDTREALRAIGPSSQRNTARVDTATWIAVGTALIVVLIGFTLSLM
jgi:hypothetical protein